MKDIGTPPPEDPIDAPNAAWITTLGLSACVLALLFSYRFLPPDAADRLWSFAHAQILTPFGFVLFAAPYLILATLLLRRAGGTSAGTTRRRPTIPAGAIAAAASLVLCWTFRQTHTFLGDSHYLLTMIPEAIRETGRIPVSFDEPLATMINGLAVLLALRFQWSAETVLRAVSVLAGAAALPLLLAAARRMAKGNRPGITGLFLVLLTAGFTGLFFGTIEAYALAMASLIAFACFSLRYLETDRGLLPASVFLGLAISLHLVCLTAVPAYLCILLHRANSLGRSRRRRRAAAPVLCALPWLFTRIWIATGDRWQLLAESHLRSLEAIPLLSGNETYFQYTLWDGRHLADAANEWLLVALPALLLAPLCAPVWFRALRRRNPAAVFLAVLAACFALFGFIWNPGRGYYADWDLFSFIGLGPVLATAWALPRLRIDGLWRRAVVAAALGTCWLHWSAWIFAGSVGFARLSVLAGG